MENLMRVWVEKQEGCDATNIYLIEGYENDKTVVTEPRCIEGKVCWEKRLVPGGEKIEPIFSISGRSPNEFLQLLTNAIYNEFKIHAKDAEPESLHLAAVKDHLNDLKRLVFEGTLREVRQDSWGKEAGKQ